MGVDFWDLPELQELDLSWNIFSRLPCSLLQLPKIKWLNLSLCENLLELSGLPSSVAVLVADYCNSLESVGDISNCKWLWKVSLIGRQNKLDAGDGELVLRSMLQGNAIEHHHFISFTHSCKIPKGFAASFNNMKNRFTMQLPLNWYNDFCGFLIRAFSVKSFWNLRIFMKHEANEDLISEIFEEFDEAPAAGVIHTFVGYVPFSSLRRATWLKGSNMITFSLDVYETNKWRLLVPGKSGRLFSVELFPWKSGRLFGVELIPRKSKGDPVGTTTDCSEFWDEDCSEFWDEELGYRKTYEIEHDSNSSLVITC